MFRNTARIAIALCFASLFASAQANSPVGTWQNISDKTGKPEAIIEIWEDKGELKGKLVKIFNAKDTICTACKGAKRNQALLGLEIIWGVQQDGDGWSGGKILDPDSGDVYSVKMSLDEGGKKLKVRGFLGFALLGRTQTWLREQ